MNNKAKMLFGLDKYEIDYPANVFLSRVNELNICLYNIEINNDHLVFYSNIEYRNKLKSNFNTIVYLRTVGLLGFSLRVFTNPFKLICIGWVFFLYMGLNSLIFDVEFHSTSNSLASVINDEIKQYYKIPFVCDDKCEIEIEKIISDKYADQITWMNIVRKGSKMDIYLTTKEIVKPYIETNNQIYSTKDAMVVEFDVLSGNKVVKLNQIVAKGDLLIDNNINDAFNINKELNTKGVVYGKTWYTIYSEMDLNKDLKVLDPLYFSRLIMNCRNEIAKEIDFDEHIISENIIEFKKEGNKIIMQVHYTLYENITK